MALTVDDIIAVKGSKYVGDVRIPTLLTLSEQMVSSSYPAGDIRNLALALDVLHQLTLLDRNSNGAETAIGVGNIIERKEGQVAVKYGNSVSPFQRRSEMAQYYDQTIYGKELLVLFKRYHVAVFVSR